MIDKKHLTLAISFHGKKLLYELNFNNNDKFRNVFFNIVDRETW